MNSLLESYAAVAGEDIIRHLRQLSAPLQGRSVVHVNSTRLGGGVAEILHKLVPLSRELGIDTHWEVVSGDADFYECTKQMHNALQGSRIQIPDRLLQHYEEVNEHNATQLRPLLEDADFVVIHDPQPAALLRHCPNRRGQWVWRCHIDVSRPQRHVWRFLERHVRAFDASIFSLPQFTRALPHREYIIAPSIDPLSEKNIDLPRAEIDAIHDRFELDPESPIIAQISRYDRFKDPVGVIEAFRMARRFVPRLQLVLAGGTATDDPEGDAVLADVREATDNDPHIRILTLPPDAHRSINALQRAAHIVLQKSTREGFGLTVTEAMWKGKPVIGGDTGGIRLQVCNYHTGFLVNTPEGAALRIRHLLQDPEKIQRMGINARELVRENFLLTRQLRDYLTLMVGLHHRAANRIDLA